MSLYSVDKQFLISESDVEQKVVIPLLTNDEPEGLGYSYIHYQTKTSLKKLNIDKGNAAKVYFPDYVVLIEGLPLVVIEVKKIGENLIEAYREARMYALEINSFYKSNINPCSLIMVTDGEILVAGRWDNNTPNVEISIENWVTTNADFSWFIENFSLNKIKELSKEFREIIRTNIFYKKPIQLLGGKHIQNQQTKNSFGETISIQYRHLFNPEEEGERSDIVQNAYVKVDKHLSHVDPIDRLIRKKISPSMSDTVEIEDNISPKEIIDKLNDAHLYNNQVLLLVGSVGSGKSTFTSYLKDVALDKTLSKKLCWIRLDLNNAPVNSSEIYHWLKKNIIEDLKRQNPDIDTEELSTIKKIYFNQIQSFDKIAGALLGEGTHSYNEKLFSVIQESINNIDITLQSYISYFVHTFHKELIIILDNCDKRTLSEQLLMFEVANWLKENIKSIVFLPLRETTFDNFRNQKPLDTVVKDLIFRINPPPLNKVLYNRISYAKRLIDKNTTKYYTLPNGFKASYPSSDELFYLKSIMSSLFQNRFFNKLMSGLTGRNIRKGIEIFLDFCKSGHITDSDIFQMKFSKGTHVLPNHLISRIFLRGNRVFYSDSDTRIKNLFFSDHSDKLPDPFVRVAILDWLNKHSRIQGPSGILGYHKVSDLLKDLTVLGHGLERLHSEITTMVSQSLILSESQNLEKVEVEELISINSPGVIHLELLKNIDYLSACSEDVYYSDDSVATEILSRINKDSTHFSLQTTFSNAKSLASYLKNYQNKFFTVHEKFLSNKIFKSPVDFEDIENDIIKTEDSKIIKSENILKNGSIVNAKIIKILRWGILLEIENSSQGCFAHAEDMEEIDFYNIDKYIIGDTHQVRIRAFKPKHSKYNVEFVS